MKSVGATAAAVVLVLGWGTPEAVHSSERTLVFRNVDVFDGSRMLRKSTVLVSGGMVRAVGPDAVVPPGAEVVDGTGKTLLPGLFDAHTHLGVVYGEQFLRDALRFGVTTELEMGGSAASVDLRRKRTAAGPLDAADHLTAATPITVPRGHPTQMDGPPIPTLAPGEDVQAFVDARIAEGADYIKVVYDHGFATFTRQQLEDVIAAAHRRNRLAVVHVLTQREAREAIAAGADGLVHVFADAPPDPDFAELAARHCIFVVPTLSVLEVVAGESATPWWRDDARLTPYVTPAIRASLERKMPPGLGANVKLAHALAAVGALHRAGVPILAGSDAPSPGLAHGLSLHRELELLVLSGLTPLEALVAATSAPARTFALHDRGRIAPGRRADLVLVNGDPTADIRATRDIVGVWKLGMKSPREPRPLRLTELLLRYEAKSFDVRSIVIRKPFVPLNSKALGPTR
jgi:imidazolonepropionase-like amidohydrolase